MIRYNLDGGNPRGAVRFCLVIILAGACACVDSDWPQGLATVVPPDLDAGELAVDGRDNQQTTSGGVDTAWLDSVLPDSDPSDSDPSDSGPPDSYPPDSDPPDGGLLPLPGDAGGPAERPPGQDLLLPEGSACTGAGGGQCQSGPCVDGVCCNQACSGSCQACNLPGTVGQCTPIPGGQDPPASVWPRPPAAAGASEVAMVGAAVA